MVTKIWEMGVPGPRLRRRIWGGNRGPARHLLREEPFALSAAPTKKAGEPGRCWPTIQAGPAPAWDRTQCAHIHVPHGLAAIG